MESKSKIKRFTFSFRKSQNQLSMPEIDQILDYNRQHPIPGEISSTGSVSTLSSDPYVLDSSSLQKKQQMRQLKRPVSLDASGLKTESRQEKRTSLEIKTRASSASCHSQALSSEPSHVTPKLETSHVTPKLEASSATPKLETSSVTPKSETSLVTSKLEASSATPKSETSLVTAKSETNNISVKKSIFRKIASKTSPPLSKNEKSEMKNVPVKESVMSGCTTNNVIQWKPPAIPVTVMVNHHDDPTPHMNTLQKGAAKEETPLPQETKAVTTDKAEKTTMVVPPSPRYNLGFLNDIQSRHKFSKAVSKQNEVATTAIQSLDCLNDQIVQYIVSTQCSKDDRVSNESVQSSMVLIRRLLLDAQVRFRKMVEDNRQLANHIDTSIQAANQEVTLLKAELASTNKRLSQFSGKEDMGKVDVAVQADRNITEETNKGDKCDSDKEDVEITVQSLTKENEQLLEDYKRLIDDHDALKCTQEEIKRENEHFKAENHRLELQLKNLKKDFDEMRLVKLEVAAHSESKPSYGELKLELIQAKQELNRAKEVLQGMKSDRKRLKGEKLDLLGQMKQLYATLEEKETELRDFIRNYEQRVKESDEMIKQLAKEKENLENEKWDIITKAKDAAERSMILKTQLDAKDQVLKETEAQLKEIRDQLASQDNNVTSTTGQNIHGETIITDIDDDNIAVADDNGFSTNEESSVLNCTFSADQDNGAQIISTSPVSISDSNDNSSLVFRWFTQGSDFEIPLESKPSKKKKKSFGSLSRVFSKGRMRRSIAVPHAECLISEDACPKLCVLSQDNYQEKLNTIEKMVGVHMKEWRAHQVLAWLEITLAMPMYAQNCLSNVKSGLILLGLSDSELSAALGVTNPMHRRKLRIAIEQHRNPNEIKFIKASEMDPTWIAHRFLPDLGLSQYTEIFEEQLCDGHVLNTLTRKDLEKYFLVHRKFHQSSILHAIELLRRIDFNKEKLYHRRNLCEDKDTDLIVWTSDRLMKWTRSIDLGEYSENLIDSGVHGSLMVLEPSFNSDTLASILGIPPSKSYIRRHLATELENILKPARAALDSAESKGSESSKSSLTRSRKSSQDKTLQVTVDRGRRKSAEEGRSRLSFRGSLGRAFGKKIRDDVKTSFDTSKISAPIPIQHSSLSALDNNSELLKKGFCVKDPKNDIYNCTPIKDPKIISLKDQDLRKLSFTRSDQTLNSHKDYRISNLIGKSNLLDKSCQDILTEGVIILQGCGDHDGNSLSSSQETLTEQSVRFERNNNSDKNVYGKKGEKGSHQSMPEISKPSQSSPLISQHVADLLLSNIPNKPVTSTSKSVNSKLFSRHSSWVDDKPSEKSKLSMKSKVGAAPQRHSHSSLMDTLFRQNHKSDNKKNTVIEGKDHFPSDIKKKDVFPQTTSV